MRFLSLLLPFLVVGVQHAFGSDGHTFPLPELPSKDPFYKPEGESWRSEPPGTILKVRNVTIASLLPYGPSKAKAYQLLYRTQNVHGEPDVSVTTIIVPVNPNFKRVLSVQNAYDSADVNCGPSYGLQFQAQGWGASWNKLNLAFMIRYLQHGPVMNIPDYEGSNASFTVGPTSAFQTLDSIRAALKSTEHPDINSAEKISADAKVIMFGYSGGAFATEWATEKRAWYAPELPIVGAVMGAPPPNVVNTYHNANNGNMSELNVAAVLGMMNAYPEMDKYMRDDLVDEETRELFLSPLRKCCTTCESIEGLVCANVSSFFKHGDYFLERFKTTLDEVGVMGRNITLRNKPWYPLMIFNGAEDEITKPIKDTEDLVSKWRRLTLTPVKHVTLANKDHTTALIGLPRAWLWIDNRFRRVEQKKPVEGDPDDDGDEIIEDPEDEMSRIEAQLNLGLSHEL
jgi:triacylglycerol lipase